MLPFLKTASLSAQIWQAAAIIVAALVLFPIAAIIWIAFAPTGDVWSHLLSTVLPRSVQTTLILMLCVGLLTSVLGIGTAWLVTMCRFPGQRIIDWALLIPLAVPTYIIAFAYVEILDYTGPVQSAIRSIFGFKTSRDY